MLFRSRVNSEGFAVITSDRHRDQEMNREDCCQKLCEMLRAAATPPKPRRKTKPSRSSREKRKTIKRFTGEKKRLRGRIRGED
jgi:ribosome-associated protein